MGTQWEHRGDKGSEERHWPPYLTCRWLSISVLSYRHSPTFESIRDYFYFTLLSFTAARDITFYPQKFFRPFLSDISGFLYWLLHNYLWKRSILFTKSFYQSHNHWPHCRRLFGVIWKMTISIMFFRIPLHCLQLHHQNQPLDRKAFRKDVQKVGNSLSTDCKKAPSLRKINSFLQ